MKQFNQIHDKTSKNAAKDSLDKLLLLFQQIEERARLNIKHPPKQTIKPHQALLSNHSLAHTLDLIAHFKDTQVNQIEYVLLVGFHHIVGS
jgi:hypothetical protein